MKTHPETNCFGVLLCLSELALSCCFRLLLALYAGLFVMLALAKFCLNAALEVRSLESAESAVNAFVLLNMDLCHLNFSLPCQRRNIAHLLSNEVIISKDSTIVNSFVKN